MSLAMALDLIFLFVTAVFAVKGLLKGFLGEAISLVATVGGVALALRLADPGGAIVADFIGEISEPVAKGIAMVVIFVAVALAGALATRVARAFLSVASLTFLDRLLGIGAGVLKSLALLMVLFVGISLAGPMVPEDLMIRSRSMVLASSIWPYVAPYVVNTGLLPQGPSER